MRRPKWTPQVTADLSCWRGIDHDEQLSEEKGSLGNDSFQQSFVTHPGKRKRLKDIWPGGGEWRRTFQAQFNLTSLVHFSIECYKSNQNQSIQNDHSERMKIATRGANIFKVLVTKVRLILLLYTIGPESGVIFLDQSENELKQNQSILDYFRHLIENYLLWDFSLGRFLHSWPCGALPCLTRKDI